MLLEYLYARKIPEGEEWQAGPGPGEMAAVADRFQASGLYTHCVGKFGGGLKVGNVVAQLVQARDSGIVELVVVAMGYLKANVRSFQVYCPLPVDIRLSTFLFLEFLMYACLHAMPTRWIFWCFVFSDYLYRACATVNQLFLSSFNHRHTHYPTNITPRHNYLKTCRKTTIPPSEPPSPIHPPAHQKKITFS